MPAIAPKVVLHTGAAGNVGGRLLPMLVEADWRVGCLARQPERLSSRVPAEVELVRGDVLDAASLLPALSGVEAVYYLVHSLGAAGDFEKHDRLAADNFGGAARAAGVRQIIYLGGFGEDEVGLSAHLRSRHEVEERLRASGVPVSEIRTSIIIGSGKPRCSIRSDCGGWPVGMTCGLSIRWSLRGCCAASRDRRRGAHESS